MQPEHIPVGDLFAKECTYTVPLFQRPYVWGKERWEPLWQDVARVATYALTGALKVRPHFLGSVVLQQRMGGLKQGPRREIIDGQQRLITLQIMIKATADVLDAQDDTRDAAQPLRSLLHNLYPPKGDPEAGYKVWPTNVDRNGFRLVMMGDNAAEETGGCLANCYNYFKKQVRDWIDEGDNQETSFHSARADSLATTIRQRLWLIALNLGDDDQAQVIFETLNARGTPLLPADLVKNLLLRQAEVDGVDIAVLYANYWQSFDEDPFWRDSVGSGHAQRARIDLFLQHALQVWTRQDVAPSEVYDIFADYLTRKSMVKCHPR